MNIQQLFFYALGMALCAQPAHADPNSDYQMDRNVANCEAVYGRNSLAAAQCVHTETQRQVDILNAQTARDAAITEQYRENICAKLAQVPGNPPFKVSGMAQFKCQP
jgi:hypothetical protein